MRYYILLLTVFSFFTLSAQDEYNQKKPEKIEAPIDNRKDSIELSKPEKKQSEPQEEDNSKAFKGMSDFKRNLRLGGAFNIGSYYFQDALYRGQLFFVQLSPQITYVMSEHFEGGITTSYAYIGSFGSINSHSFSAGPILRAYPLDQIFLQVEGVGFYNTASRDGFKPYTTFNFNAFVGGGIVSRFSQTSYLLTGIKINLMKNELTYNQIIPTAFTSIHFGLW